VTVIAGARAGKDSRIAAPIVLYEALFGGHTAHLAKGERAVIPLVAQDQRATRVAFGYVRDYLLGSPLLRDMVAEVLTLEIALTNRLNIWCFPSTLRSLRGWSIPVGVMDELGYFRLEGQADSDADIQASIRRGMLAFPAPRLVKISTPYLKGGVLYEDFQKGWGQDHPDLLVWRASSRLMNPSLQEARLERERRLDPSRYSREYEALFVDDLSAFLPGSLIERAIEPNRVELPPRVRSVSRYFAAVDPSGGGADAFTLAIVHLEQQRIVQDVMRGWVGSKSKPLELGAVTREIAELCRRYGIPHVVGDRYGAEWVRQAFREAGLRYYESPWPKSDAYRELEPLLIAEQLELLDHVELLRELRCLERRLRPGDRVTIDHPSGAHDDYANALALATTMALRSRELNEPDEPEDSVREELEREEEITQLRDQLRELGISDADVSRLEAMVGREELPGYLESVRDEYTLAGRLRRGGL